MDERIEPSSLVSSALFLYQCTRSGVSGQSGLDWSGLDMGLRGGYIGIDVDQVGEWLRRSDLCGYGDPFDKVKKLDQQSRCPPLPYRLVRRTLFFSQLHRLGTLGCNGAMLKCERFEACRAL